MFARILVPLDGSQLAETVLPHVVAIAKTNKRLDELPTQSHVTLLRVLDPVAGITRPRSVDPLDWQLRKAEAEAYLQKLAAQFLSLGLETSTEVQEGKAAETVIRYASEHESSLIMLSSHGQSGISGWNISSVVQKIIQLARTSVMIVRAYHPTPAKPEDLHYQHILLPLDGSQRAETVLPVAQRLARQHDAELVVAHVVRKPEMPRRTPPSQEDLELAERITERNRVEAEKYLADLESRFGERLMTRLLISDSVQRSLHELVKHQEIDLVLVSAHGYTGERMWRYGSTVVSFIAYGTTPLLIIQDLPPGAIESTEAELTARKYGGR